MRTAGEPFDDVKAARLVDAFMAALRREQASAGEACAAASFVLKNAVAQARTRELKAALKKACRRILAEA